jgi:hypothetical protein
MKSHALILFACLAWVGFGQHPPAVPAAPENSFEQLVESLPSDWRPIVVKYRDLMLSPDWYLNGRRTTRGDVVKYCNH